MDYNKHFMDMAERYLDYLLNHEVLRNYLEDISIILKGSTARGNTDQLSDVDFVIFCDPDVFQKIINDYKSLDLIKRDDGVFLPLGDWVGHYNLDTYSSLKKYMYTNNIEEIWEYSNVKIFHDPFNKYAEINEKLKEFVLSNNIELIKERYLSLQLYIDWLRHPLKRGDYISSQLHVANIVRQIMALCCLFDGKAYPHDKWLAYYFEKTSLGKKLKSKIDNYIKVSAEQDIKKYLELSDYFQYVEAEDMAGIVINEIRAKFGNFNWIDEWYLFT